MTNLIKLDFWELLYISRLFKTTGFSKTIRRAYLRGLLFGTKHYIGLSYADKLAKEWYRRKVPVFLWGWGLFVIGFMLGKFIF